MSEINPDYVSAPYRVSFLFWIPGPPQSWSRKRRLKWIRRKRQTEIKKFKIHPKFYHRFEPADWRGEA